MIACVTVVAQATACRRNPGLPAQTWACRRETSACRRNPLGLPAQPPRPAGAIIPACRAIEDFFVPWGQNRGQNPFTYSPRMAELLEFFDRPMKPRVGFELPVPREKKSRNLGIPSEFN